MQLSEINGEVKLFNKKMNKNGCLSDPSSQIFTGDLI